MTFRDEVVLGEYLESMTVKVRKKEWNEWRNWFQAATQGMEGTFAYEAARKMRRFESRGECLIQTIRGTLSSHAGGSG